MADHAIVTQGLTRRFGKKTAVDGLDLQVPTGCVFGFLGRNGAGKTTTMKMLLNILEPSEGSAEILGLDTRRDSLEIKKRIGYVSDHPVMYGWMKIEEVVWTVRCYTCQANSTKHWNLVELLSRKTMGLPMLIQTWPRFCR